MLCSLFFLVVMKQLNLVQYPRPNWSTNKKVAPLSIAFVGMVLTGLAALKYLNIPMFKSAHTQHCPAASLWVSSLTRAVARVCWCLPSR
jgi:hypothetical protein